MSQPILSILESYNYDETKIGWLDIPKEVRQNAIERLDAKNRFKFSRCSQTCEKDVMESKNFITALSLKKQDLEVYELRVAFFGEPLEVEPPEFYSESERYDTISKNLLVTFRRNGNNLKTKAFWRKNFKIGYPTYNLPSQEVAYSIFLRFLNCSQKSLTTLMIDIGDDHEFFSKKINLVNHKKIVNLHFGGKNNLICTTIEQLSRCLKLNLGRNIVRVEDVIKLTINCRKLAIDMRHWIREDYRRFIQAWINEEIVMNFGHIRGILSIQELNTFSYSPLYTENHLLLKEFNFRKYTNWGFLDEFRLIHPKNNNYVFGLVFNCDDHDFMENCQICIYGCLASECKPNCFYINANKDL